MAAFSFQFPSFHYSPPSLNNSNTVKVEGPVARTPSCVHAGAPVPANTARTIRRRRRGDSEMSSIYSSQPWSGRWLPGDCSCADLSTGLVIEWPW